MKKLFFAVLAIAALTISSCGNKTKNAAEATDSLVDSTAVVDTTALAPETQSMFKILSYKLSDVIAKKDPKVLTTVLADIASSYKALVNAGNLKDALPFAQLVKDYVAKNAEAIKTIASGNETINGLLTTIQNLPTDAATTAEAAKAAVTNDAVNLASTTLQKAAAAGATAQAAAAALKSMPTVAAETAATAVDQAKAAAVDQANQTVEGAKQEATDAANKTVTDAKAKANQSIDDAAAAAKKGLGL